MSDRYYVSDVLNRQRWYLSAILDLYNNEIVAYEISERNDLQLVLKTVKKAIKNEMSMASSSIAIKDTNTSPKNITNYYKNTT